MPRYRDRLPDDLKELISLVRIGKFVAVEKWISQGKRYAIPSGNFITTPFHAAVETGFHSMVEVFLKAGVEQDEMDDAMGRAVWNANLVLIKLLRSHGADPLTVSFEDVIRSEDSAIIRWFIDRGLDLQEGFPIAYAFRYEHQGFLGIYKGLRDSEPTARQQATMALRFHCIENNLDWVSLLLEAGADPRLPVWCIHNPGDPKNIGTALEDAITFGRADVVQKIGLDRSKDDVTALLTECWMGDSPALIEMLLEAGADPNGVPGERSITGRLVERFAQDAGGHSVFSNTASVVNCIEIVARAGGRWKPDKDGLHSVRREMGHAQPFHVLPYWVRIVDSGAIEREVFRDLMRTPKMKEFLNYNSTEGVNLREYAGHLPNPAARKTAQLRTVGVSAKLSAKSARSSSREVVRDYA